MPNASDWQKLKKEMLKKPEYARAYAQTPALELAFLVTKTRKAMSITQKQLAEMVGTKQPAIARLEKGDYAGCTIRTLTKIAEVLGKSLKISFGQKKSHILEKAA